MKDRVTDVLRKLAQTSARFDADAPEPVLLQLTAAGAQADILVSTAQGSKSESLSASLTSVPKSTNKARTTGVDPQCSNNELMDAMRHIVHRVRRVRHYLNNHGIWRI